MWECTIGTPIIIERTENKMQTEGRAKKPAMKGHDVTKAERALGETGAQPWLGKKDSPSLEKS